MKRKAAARDEAPVSDEAPAEAYEEEATRQAKRMKSEELRAALEAAGVDDTEGNKPALVERLVAAKKRAAAGDNDDDEAAPAAFDEEDATRLAKRMKVEELRAALEAAGAEDTEGTKPVLVERLVAAQRAAASPPAEAPAPASQKPQEEDSDDDFAPKKNPWDEENP